MWNSTFLLLEGKQKILHTTSIFGARSSLIEVKIGGGSGHGHKLCSYIARFHYSFVYLCGVMSYCCGFDLYT